MPILIDTNFTLTTGTAQPFYQQITTIESTQYLLEMRFNQRENVWYLRIMLPDATILCQGIKLVPAYWLLAKYNNASLPDGDFLVTFSGQDDSPPALNDLLSGGRCSLLYFSKDELPSTADRNRI